MATIERKPLPPPGVNATTLTEADRSEFFARANEVIDHYLNGPGSYWDEGPRKSLDETLSDLRVFKSHVAASKQLADDPHGILDSVADLVERTMEGVKRAIKDQNGEDCIESPLPETNDRIIRVPRNYSEGISYRGYAPREFRTGRDSVPQGMPLLGLVSGEPMSFHQVQPPIWDLSGSSLPSEDAVDLLTRSLRGGPRR